MSAPHISLDGLIKQNKNQLVFPDLRSDACSALPSTEHCHIQPVVPRDADDTHDQLIRIAIALVGHEKQCFLWRDSVSKCDKR